MICVIGAGGTVGSELVRQLEIRGAAFRAAYASPAKADAARRRGLDAVVVDGNRPGTLRAAMDGCQRLFLLGPNVPKQAQLELNAVESAQAGGVQHIVKLSVLRADEDGFAIARVHRHVERAIESSLLAWTFLRPNGFMQNVVNYMASTILAEGAFYTASGTAEVSHVDVRDIAAVAVHALTGPGHEGKAYTLTGPEALTYDELAGQLSQALGRPISHVSLSPSDLGAGMRAQGLPKEAVDDLLDLERYFRDGQAALVTGDIRQVTGRDARRFADFARHTAASRLLSAGGS